MTQPSVHSLIEAEQQHRADVRQAVFVIMHNLIYLDTTGMSVGEIQLRIHEFVPTAYGTDVARIASERVIDCLMYL